MRGWIGVDLDGTLAYYDEWRGITHIGEPIPAMLARVKRWIAEGKDVRIVTARAGLQDDRDFDNATVAIQAWLMRHVGKRLPITDRKDFDMIELWDDRCVQVQVNTGKRIDGRTD
jgi:hypothetical protein